MRTGTLTRPLPPPPSFILQVSQSAFAYLFSEFIQYSQARSVTANELELKCAPRAHTLCTSLASPASALRLDRARALPPPPPPPARLEEAGAAIGVRVLELVALRDGKTRRETRMQSMLQYINSTVWKVLFGKAADALSKSVENEDEYMISELDPLVNQFISVPPSLPNLNCAAFVAGIVRGILEASGFPARVTAHTDPSEASRTILLIKFAPEVIAREKALAGGQ